MILHSSVHRMQITCMPKNRLSRRNLTIVVSENLSTLNLQNQRRSGIPLLDI